LKGGGGEWKKKDGRGGSGGESDGVCSGSATGGFPGYTPDVGLSPLKLEHTQARTRHLMTESCFSQTEDHFPSPLLLSPLPSLFPLLSLPSPSRPFLPFLLPPHLFPLLSLPPFSFPLLPSSLPSFVLPSSLPRSRPLKSS